MLAGAEFTERARGLRGTAAGLEYLHRARVDYSSSEVMAEVVADHQQT